MSDNFIILLRSTFRSLHEATSVGAIASNNLSRMTPEERRRALFGDRKPTLRE